MKIDINLAGPPARPGDYARLRQALMAAQAATPTARAAREAAEQVADPAGATPPFADLLGTDGAAAAREHRFAPEGGEAP